MPPHAQQYAPVEKDTLKTPVVQNNAESDHRRIRSGRIIHRVTESALTLSVNFLSSKSYSLGLSLTLRAAFSKLQHSTAIHAALLTQDDATAHYIAFTNISRIAHVPSHFEEFKGALMTQAIRLSRFQISITSPHRWFCNGSPDNSQPKFAVSEHKHPMLRVGRAR